MVRVQESANVLRVVIPKYISQQTGWGKGTELLFNYLRVNEVNIAVLTEPVEKVQRKQIIDEIIEVFV